MKSEKGVLLQLMPPGVNMDMGKGYDDNDQLRHSSISQCCRLKTLELVKRINLIPG